MLLWMGILLIAAGLAAIAVDRQSSHAIYDRVGAGFWRFLDATTHLAKASHWLIAAALLYAAAWFWHFAAAQRVALAFVASVAAGSVILHAIKLVLGRRRPRDDIEMGLYGFEFLAFDLDHNSFPSGHALTITCVAVVASAIWPMLWPLWFAVAAWLALTRALLTAHYLSDVLVGAGIGMIAAREASLLLLAQTPGWF
ncbi:MAG: phosphatase PAP2 family protein [Alphaproteobacteria bacterium]|nr:phosphatase PAP2 family protein [Alphaproteobacteria bacterium]MBV9692124.1 phosphatase PAP2 family protein [Alphaproteobacteria bacterium]